MAWRCRWLLPLALLLFVDLHAAIGHLNVATSDVLQTLDSLDPESTHRGRLLKKKNSSTDGESEESSTPSEGEDVDLGEVKKSKKKKKKKKSSEVESSTAADSEASSLGEEASDSSDTSEKKKKEKKKKKKKAEEEEESDVASAADEPAEESTVVEEREEEADNAADSSSSKSASETDKATSGDDASKEGSQEGDGTATLESPFSVPTAYPKGDISPKGNCSKDIKAHCKGVTVGNSNLANCIAFHVKNEKAGNSLAAIPVSDDCKAEVRAFKVEKYKDLSLDSAMAAACKSDISKFCDDDFLYPEPGNIVACLREAKQVESLTDACKAQVLRAQMDAADDFKADPQLNELCSGEAERLCKGVQPGEGRVQDCLRNHRSVLAWDCQAELFRQEVENADDIRLNVRLFQACLNDQRKFCAEVKYGDARVKDCLEEHRLDPDFSPQCKTEFDKMMERRAADFRLDSKLRKYCKNDISEICYPDAEEVTDVANWDAKVIQCLQDYRDELKDPKCKKQVHKLTVRAAEDMRFDKPLADACYSDRMTLCKGVPHGMAQVFLCLHEHSNELKEVCRAALFDELVRFAEDIDFKFPMKRACSKELKKFCADVPPGHAARIQCLQDKIDDADMGEQCRTELNNDLKRTSEDYRLNYRLNKACYTDVNRLCTHACDRSLESGAVSCQGTVLKCLQQNATKIASEACRKELFHFSKLVARDPLTFDLPLHKACAANISTLCKDVSRDHYRTLACLRKKRDKLSKECKAEEMRYSIMEASDIRLTPTLMNACGQELSSLCATVPPTEGRAFKCLQEHLEEVTMGAACKAEVNLQELRHASNYRLDVRVRTECAADVTQFCADADKGEEGHALVLKCMVDNYKRLSGACQTEVSYAMRMALWQYKMGAPLTEVCDETVKSLCPDASSKAIEGVVIGTYGQCLVATKRDKLSDECRVLVKLVAKDGGHAGGKVDEARLDETLQKIAQLQATAVAAVSEANKAVEESAAAAAAAASKDDADEGGLVIKGWVAAVALGALVIVVVGVLVAVYLQVVSPYRNYALVVKGTGGV